MPVTKHVVNIDSAGRDTTAYPTPSQYQIPLASRYRNIWEARLVNITIPELDPPRRNMFLRIDNLNNYSRLISGYLNQISSRDIDIGYQLI